MKISFSAIFENLRSLYLPLWLLLTHAACAQCGPNQYDMLTWMLPTIATQNVHYNVLQPRTGTFYWLKSANGYPWDVDTFDARRIYQSITENVWTDPTTYKQFDTPMPWMPRCVNIPTTSGKLSSITVPSSQTNFFIHTSCKAYAVQNLGYVVNELWGPYTLDVGGNIPPNLTTLILSYRYSCDSTYLNCQFKETFALQQGIGLVQWTLYALQNGRYVQQNQTTENHYQIATITPVHPCWN